MKKIVAEMVCGIIFVLSGSFLFIFAIFTSDINPDNLIVFLIPGIFCIIAGAFLAIHARKRQTVFLAQALLKKQESMEKAVSENLIQKQRGLLDQWNKINGIRDKLKMLKISANAQKESA